MNDRARPHAPTSATVLVTGATGRVGHRVVARLVAAGLRPRCLLREPDSVTRLGSLAPAIEPAFGDMDDPQALRAALAGVERVFLMSPIHARMQAWQEQVVDAIAASGTVRHVVKLSGSTWTLGPQDATVSGQAHAAVEARLAEAGPRAGFHTTCLRPGVFTEGFLKTACDRMLDTLAGAGTASVAGAGAPSGSAAGDIAPSTPLTLAMPIADAHVAFVTPEALATIAADALCRPGAGNRTIEITFDSAVDGDAIAATATQLLGRPVRYRPAPVEQALAVAAGRLTGFELRHVGEMLVGIATGRAARPARPAVPGLDRQAWQDSLAALLRVNPEPA